MSFIKQLLEICGGTRGLLILIFFAGCAGFILARTL